MPDRVKQKLVELLNAIDGVCPKDASCYDCEYKDVTHCAIPAKADYLIANGVTVQELDGCEYCKHSESIYHHSSGIHDSMDEDVYISGNNIVVDIGCHSYGTEEIKFCPMCGRRFPQPPKGE